MAAESSPRRGRRVTLGVVLLLVVATALAWVAASSSATALTRTSLKVNFSTKAAGSPRGYLTDYGQPFSKTRGYGWEKVSNSRGFSIVGNGRKRTKAPGSDLRYTTLIQMQTGPAARTPVQWQAAVANGLYTVTIAVGDPAAVNSTHRVVAQPGTRNQVVLVGGYRPTAKHRFDTVTTRVRVTGGLLTLRATGGHNTKIDFIIVAPVPAPKPPTPSGTSLNLTTGGTVSQQCIVTGFSGVMPNSSGNQCVPGKLAFTHAGLAIMSTPGQLADDNQQNAVYKTFNAGRDFTISARVVGPVDQLTANYEQIGAFFGPDQDNFVKVEAEHNGPGAPHVTMFYRDNKAAGVVATLPMPALTSSSTLDLIIRSRGGSLTVYYSLDGATPLQIGAARTPSTPSAWFTGTGKAGVLTSNSGSPTSITATFSRFSISFP